MECGATGIIALHQTAQRNNRLNKESMKKAKDRLERESKLISMTLTAFAALKQKKPTAYWVFSLTSSQQDLSMILRLLALDSGVTSKGKQQQWKYIEENLSPMLSQAAVDAKAEEYIRHLATIAVELSALVDEQEDDLEPAVVPVGFLETAQDPCNHLENDRELPAEQPDGSVPTA